MFSPEYACLSTEEKALLLNTETCPTGGLPGCDDIIMPCILTIVSDCVMQKYVFSPEYARLSTEEKALLLETGTCPTGGLPGCDDMVMNYAVDWNLLHGALVIAFEDLHSRHSHILDGTG